MIEIESQVLYLITIKSFRPLFSQTLSEHCAERLKNFCSLLEKTRPDQCSPATLSHFKQSSEMIARTVGNKFNKSFSNYVKENNKEYASCGKKVICCTKGCACCIRPLLDKSFQELVSVAYDFDSTNNYEILKKKFERETKGLLETYNFNQAPETKILADPQFNITSEVFQKILLNILQDEIKLFSYLPTEKALEAFKGKYASSEDDLPYKLIKNTDKTTQHLLELSRQLNSDLNKALKMHIKDFIKDTSLKLTSDKNFKQSSALSPSDLHKLDLYFMNNCFYKLLTESMIAKNLCTSRSLVSISESKSKFRFFCCGSKEEVTEPIKILPSLK